MTWLRCLFGFHDWNYRGETWPDDAVWPYEWYECQYCGKTKRHRIIFG